MKCFSPVLLVGILLLCTVEASGSQQKEVWDLDSPQLVQRKREIRRRPRLRRKNCQSPSNPSGLDNNNNIHNESTSSASPSSTSSDESPTSEASPDSYGGSGSSSGKTYSGDGTYFTPGLGACGKTNTDEDLIAAINAPQYGTYANPNSALVCGKCALVKGSLGQVKVTITDKCPPCKYGDLDLSPAAFEQIGDMVDGRIPITWSFVDC